MPRAAIDEKTEVSAAVLGQAIGLSRPRIEQLVGEGVIAKAGRGRFPLIASVSAYIAWMKDENRRASKSATDSALKLARQREVEQRIAERANRLVDIEEHEAIVDELVGMFVSALVGLPARLTRDREERSKVERECDRVRDQIADLCARRKEQLRASGETAATGAEADA